MRPVLGMRRFRDSWTGIGHNGSDSILHSLGENPLALSLGVPERIGEALLDKPEQAYLHIVRTLTGHPRMIEDNSGLGFLLMVADRCSDALYGILLTDIR